MKAKLTREERRRDLTSGCTVRPARNQRTTQQTDTRIEWGNADMRRAVYEAGDKIGCIHEEARTHGEDQILQKIQAELIRAHDALMKHLNNHYKWD